MDIVERINVVMKYVLFQRDEITEEQVEAGDPRCVIAEGIVTNFVFHKERLAEKYDEIVEILKLMPDAFHTSVGGGWSFLNLCQTENGIQWTGEHRMVEALCCLAIASELGTWCVPREYWCDLPGGMPYVSFNI